MALARKTTLHPVVQPTPKAPQRHLRPVPSTATHPKTGTLGLAIIAIVAVLGIFATQLWLSVATSQGAYTANDLILEERELARIERVMQQEVYVASSPQNLSKKASAQGMVQNAQPAFLALEDSVIQGELQQSSSATRPNIVPNAALTAMNTPLAEKIQAERQAAAEKKAAEEKAQAAEAEKTASAAVAAQQTPQGPVSWSGQLPAPATH